MENIEELLEFIEWREGLKHERLGGKLMYDIPNYYKRIEEDELFDYYNINVK